MNRVTMTTRVESANDAHTTISVFVGRQRGSRALAGTLTLGTDEYEELFDRRHLIELRPDGWTIQHPLHERLEGSLFDCAATWDLDDIGMHGRFVLVWDEQADEWVLGDRL